jgi:hypothetical protein
LAGYLYGSPQNGYVKNLHGFSIHQSPVALDAASLAWPLVHWQKKWEFSQACE